jgi:hypothetical protein
MNCQEFLDSTPELSGELTGDASLHARQCASCGAYMEHHRRLAEGLRAAAAEWKRMKAPGAVEGRLLAAFRGQAGTAAPAAPRVWWVSLAAWAGAGAVVTAAVAFLFVASVHKGGAPQADQTAQAGSVDWTAGLPEEASRNADEFIPLPNAERLPPNERMNMVRVELPRSAMIALGYAVTADSADDMVQADVVLGSDGLARAVRLVKEETQ